MRIRWKSILPAIGVVVGALGDPQVLAVLPSKISHVILIVSAIAAAFTPAVLTNKPKDIYSPNHYEG